MHGLPTGGHESVKGLARETNPCGGTLCSVWEVYYIDYHFLITHMTILCKSRNVLRKGGGVRALPTVYIGEESGCDKFFTNHFLERSFMLTVAIL